MSGTWRQQGEHCTDGVCWGWRVNRGCLTFYCWILFSSILLSHSPKHVHRLDSYYTKNLTLIGFMIIKETWRVKMWLAVVFPYHLLIIKVEWSFVLRSYSTRVSSVSHSTTRWRQMVHQWYRHADICQLKLLYKTWCSPNMMQWSLFNIYNIQIWGESLLNWSLSMMHTSRICSSGVTSQIMSMYMYG